MNLAVFMKKAGCVVVLCLIAGLIAHDSLFHFDKELVALKRQHQSAQRHWNLFYTQQYTYFNSPFRYQQDLVEIKKLIEPGVLMLSDKATSYYLAAELPVFVANVHRHHKLDYQWKKAFDKRLFCYLEQPNVLLETDRFIERQKHRITSNKKPVPEFKYIVLNRDHRNLNTRQDCLSAKGGVATSLEKIAKSIYKGEHLHLYRVL